PGASLPDPCIRDDRRAPSRMSLQKIKRHPFRFSLSGHRSNGRKGELWKAGTSARTAPYIAGNLTTTALHGKTLGRLGGRRSSIQAQRTRAVRRRARATRRWAFPLRPAASRLSSRTFFVSG